MILTGSLQNEWENTALPPSSVHIWLRGHSVHHGTQAEPNATDIPYNPKH